MYTQEEKTVLSFQGENLTRGIHKVHPYPAMLHPLLVDYLLEMFAKPNTIVFDPFCGSGVTLTQSAYKGYQSYGFDINPLSLLIAKTKTDKYDIKLLEKEYQNLRSTIQTTHEYDVPDIPNIEYWYTQDVIKDLGTIRKVLQTNKYTYRDFFVTAFSFVCRNQSLTRNGEFKRYRVPNEKIMSFENKVLPTFFKHIETMIQIIQDNHQPNHTSTPLLANSENPISPNIKYDLVITSPPYGDSKTTVAYGQYSSFGLDWTKGLNSFGDVQYKVDNESLGKKGELNDELLQHSVLKQIINLIEKEDGKRAQDVLFFFNGYYKAIKNTIHNLNPNGTVCFVVGNRTVKGHQIPMDQITASFLETCGLKIQDIFVRVISNKVMPHRNSPTNITGATSATMTKEYIIIGKKN